MKLILIFAVVLASLILIFQLSFIMATTETQAYEVIKSENDYEIRLYPPVTLATISMNVDKYKELSSPGFRKLATYIFGGNNANKKINMTSPVHMDINDSLSTMSFVMPSNYNKDNLPLPNDASVAIESTLEQCVAAIRFSGYADDAKIKKYAAILESALRENGTEFYGNFRFLGYNAPYQLLGRKNEIIVNVRWDLEKK